MADKMEDKTRRMSKQTTTTTTTTTVTTKKLLQQPDDGSSKGVALVEELGHRQDAVGGLNRLAGVEDKVEGNKLVTSISTIAAQSGQSRIVLAMLKDGPRDVLKIQEMRPGIYEVGASLKECSLYLLEHRRILKKLAHRNEKREGPIEGWLVKYYALHPERMTAERKLVYLCMLENLRACWQSLLNQLELRHKLLEEARKFYELSDQLSATLEQAERHTESSRKELLAGSRGGENGEFSRAVSELDMLNLRARELHKQARKHQRRTIELVSVVAAGNLGDARPGWLLDDARTLIDHLARCLKPLELRQLQLDRVVQSASSNTEMLWRLLDSSSANSSKQQLGSSNSDAASVTYNSTLYSDLNLVESWLATKVEQLNSSLLASLGLGVPDSRTILNKHEQIALECRAIEDAAMRAPTVNTEDSTELRSLLAARARLVISIIEARMSLLKRTIDFYLRAREASADLDRMTRRLELDNSLQSVQFVATELELRDVSSVVASGGTIVSELQQLQLAQQQGERPRLVTLALATSGLRTAIDQLSQELSQVKTALNQRKLLLLNEDSTKLSSTFSAKCHQLQLWLNSQLKSFLQANEQIPLDNVRARAYCEAHKQLRDDLQARTSEVEALVRCANQLRDSGASNSLDPKLERKIDELQSEWIEASNSLDRRLELTTKYLELLAVADRLRAELDALDSFQSGRVSAERSEPEIRESVELAEEQLGKQVNLFSGQQLKRYSDDEPTNCRDLRNQAVQVQHELHQLKERLYEPPSKRQNQRQLSNAAYQPDPPRFIQILPTERLVEPFSNVELECEVEPADCKLDWLMNNFKRIPPTIKHSISSDSRGKHKLIINNFSPHCCATYLARASNPSGQKLSQCRLKLIGISETTNDEQQHTRPVEPRSDSTEVTSTTSYSQLQQQKQQPTSAERKHNNNMERLIKGVNMRQQQNETETEIEINRAETTSSFSSHQQNNHLQLVPANSSSKYTNTETTNSYNNLQPPFVSPAPSTPITTETATPNPRSLSNTPVCQQDSTLYMSGSSRSCSRAGSLVCLVLGSPAPNIEWLHNNRLVASAKCARNDLPNTTGVSANNNSYTRGNLCKLTIETASPVVGNQQQQLAPPTSGGQIFGGKNSNTLMATK